MNALKSFRLSIDSKIAFRLGSEGGNKSEGMCQTGESGKLTLFGWTQNCPVAQNRIFVEECVSCQMILSAQIYFVCTLLQGLS